MFGGGATVTLKELTHADGGIGGASTFDSGIALGSWIVRNKNSVAGKQVLELGSGTGLVSSLLYFPLPHLKFPLNFSAVVYCKTWYIELRMSAGGFLASCSPCTN